MLPVVAALRRHGRGLDRHPPRGDGARRGRGRGATLVNDVSASLDDVAAELGVGWVAMHMQGDPRTMQHAPTYTDVVGEVRDFLVERAEAAMAAGRRRGLDRPRASASARTSSHNLALLAHLDVLVATGFPVLVGLSRKAFLGRLLAASDAMAGAPALPGPRRRRHLGRHDTGADRRPLEGSLAAAVWAAMAGAAMIRVHDVAATVQAVDARRRHVMVGPR